MRLGICGLGTVGGGTLRLLQEKRAEITRRVGRELNVVRVATRRRPKDHDLKGMEFSTDVFDVARDPEVDVLVELIGGFDPALELVLLAIENGKHVVTANKALIAIHGNTIFAAARRKGVTVAYEAAVAGGIPVIKALREGLAANSIDWVAGIINGTGNYILSEMGEKQRVFSDVLKEAQELGYAEADPTFDVEGIDAAHKLAILASNAFGVELQFDRVYTEGISHITPEDLSYADELGYTVKHLGIARSDDDGIELRVHPTLISKQTLLANVNGVMNAIWVKGDSAGSTLYYGAGAGAEATASSVVADIIDITRAGASAAEGTGLPPLAFDGLRDDLPVREIQDIESAYYLRIPAHDRPGVMASITQVLEHYGINIEAVIQKEPQHDEDNGGVVTVPVVLLTGSIREAQMDIAIGVIEQLDQVAGKVMRIRVEHFDAEE
ncbi:MAG: homoserine dehydrogenase [Pseudomonadota bacterium]